MRILSQFSGREAPKKILTANINPAEAYLKPDGRDLWFVKGGVELAWRLLADFKLGD